MTTVPAPVPAGRWRRRLGAALVDGRERWLLCAAALALAAGLLHPGVTTERGLFNHVVVIDVTQSMNVLDHRLAGRPASRLVFAKQALRQALLRLPCGSKVGWAVFTEYRSFLLLAPVEVCANLSELRSSLERIDGRMAWSGNSEVAKAVHSAVVIARSLEGTPSLVFVTDGHEAPPLNPRFRPSFDDKPGEVAGLIVGVGGALPLPIPKTDPEGRPLGFWRADEVMQTDPRSQGRGGSVSGERMVDGPADNGPEAATAAASAAAAAASLGTTPGAEHLSSLRENYLRLLAAEQRFGFLRLDTAEALGAALAGPSLARPTAVRTDAQPALGALALLLLLLRSGSAWQRRSGRPGR